MHYSLLLNEKKIMSLSILSVLSLHAVSSLTYCMALKHAWTMTKSLKAN